VTPVSKAEILRRLMAYVPASGAISTVDCPMGPYRDLRYVITRDGFRLCWRLRTWIWYGDLLPEKGLGDPRLYVSLHETESGCDVDFKLRHGPFGLHAVLFVFPIFFLVAPLMLDGPSVLWLPALLVAAVIMGLWWWPYQLSSRGGSVQPLLGTLHQLTHPDTVFTEIDGRLEVTFQSPPQPEPKSANRPPPV
jgi:hypothetical protein